MVRKITLMEAYVLEALKAANVADEVILEKVEAQRVEDFQELVESAFDFDVLYGIQESLPSILNEGYEVKFLTFPGLKRLLSLKLQKEEEKDYTVQQFQIEQLQLTADEKVIVQTFLSANWVLEPQSDHYVIKPNEG